MSFWLYAFGGHLAAMGKSQKDTLTDLTERERNSAAIHAYGESVRTNLSPMGTKRRFSMKITARINEEKQDIVDILTQHGITAKLVRGGVIVELPVRKKESWNEPDVYEVPTEVNSSAILLIDVAEEGGGMTNTGSGTVVCGLSGKALRPYYMPRGGHLACGTHAYFSVPNAVVTVTGYRRDNNITIDEHRIIREGNIARIHSKKLWSGEAPTIEWECLSCGAIFTDECPTEHNQEDGSKCYGEPRRSKVALPISFERFQVAAMAARTKGDCYHCRCVHFAEAR
jgi:hypothetical protein